MAGVCGMHTWLERPVRRRLEEDPLPAEASAPPSWPIHAPISFLQYVAELRDVAWHPSPDLQW